MPRRKEDELQFSTDSFLDVVCNLVGILIILIIVAGLRVSRAPVILAQEETAPAAPADGEPPLPVLTVPPSIKLTELGGWLEAAPAAPDEAPAELPPPAEPPSELVAQAEQLRTLMSQLAEQQAELRDRAAAARRSEQAAGEQLRDVAARVEAEASGVEAKAADAEQVAHRIRELEELVATLKNESVALAEQSVQAHVLKHNVTPISRQVSEQDEVHFRLEGNKVSVVPMDALAEVLKQRMQKSGDLFIRLDRYEGTAGPVDGYVMHYVIEKTKPSAIEELRNGGSFVRIQLTYYELEVRKEIVSETVDEALRPGSKFMTALHKTRPGSSLTFWVYPDSFAAHRKLQDFAHEARFDVAARPLPFGVPIAGSPHGSKSSAQ